MSNSASRFAALVAAASLILPLDALADELGEQGTRATEPSGSTVERIDALSAEVAELKALVRQLQQEIATTRPPAVVDGDSAPPAAHASALVAPGTAAAPAVAPPKVLADALRGITLNALFDGYYEWNANHPLGRVNYLRAYDVSSNSFSINQADLVIESAADVANGKRYGLRLDLQYGQATQTLQGNPANELRPDVYRNLYQAYGTYVFPIGTGLDVDFGKFASSLGTEGNYTKDQLNYSRSWWFNYLPFYHTGVRAKYAVNDQIALNLWVVNGAQQSEADNDYKDQLLGIVVTPIPTLTWTVNFYQGQEHPDVLYVSNPTPAEQNLPLVQGTAIQPIAHAADGKLWIGDTYVSWQATPALVLGGEADSVQERLYSDSSPERVTGGALYAGYQLTPVYAIAVRTEYLADRGGLFSGITQYLKEQTLTFDYRPSDGFLLRAEYRRDASNRPYFLGHELGVLETVQPTLGLGVVWWIGQKTGTW